MSKTSTSQISSSRSKDNFLDWEQFDEAIAATSNPLPIFRQQLSAAQDILRQDFENDVNINQLVRGRVKVVDQLLVRAWDRLFTQAEATIALIAVGGYGRGELHPASDIDLLILTSSSDDTSANADNIEQFLLFLWDMGLEVGHSVRTINDCIEQAEADITVATNLMEARILAGPEALFNKMKEAISPQHIWPSLEFFRGKREEQINRHRRFHHTAYNLEPNIKENPGGLRDLQVIGWVAKRHFGAETLHELVEHGFLTENEYYDLVKAQNFLWKIRFALHILTNRREDRLLFDHQRTLAKQFGYHDREHKLAVEQFMRDYYRTVMELSRLNEMLLELFEEDILFANEKTPPVAINERFQYQHGILEVTHPNVFKQEPTALLEIFVLMARHPELRGVSANTIRLIRDNRHLIDEDFRKDPRANDYFISLFKQGTGLTHELHRMNRYGVLAMYLPAFGKIVGQMQHDLFHVYTVDEHTMFVVRNLRRFTVPEHAHEFPLCTRIMKGIEKQEVLTLAGFFHDIAKGRGGDHSTLGAVDAVEFCQEHGISKHDTELVRWLVEQHLIMSTTAQRKDISDPEVIADFAALVGTQKRLNHIYLLTVADIRATSPDLWNSWKDALLKELYHATSRALRRGLDTPIDQEEIVHDVQEKCLEKLELLGADLEKIKTYWQRFDPEYFLRHSCDEIVWHARVIGEHHDTSRPLVVTRKETHRGGTEIFVYMQDNSYVFSIITSTLEQMGLNITDARIITSNDNYTLDTFLVLEQDGTPISNSARLREVQMMLSDRLQDPEHIPHPSVQAPRQLKYFPIETEVLFREDENNNRTVLEVIATDRPGLLARIARAMLDCELLLQNAKIATFGERAEDIFFVTDTDYQPLSEEKQECVRETITHFLDNNKK
ncbi:[protein-PII] uridylyltransferase [Kaarinaea lacus]